MIFAEARTDSRVLKDEMGTCSERHAIGIQLHRESIRLGIRREGGASVWLVQQGAKVHLFEATGPTSILRSCRQICLCVSRAGASPCKPDVRLEAGRTSRLLLPLRLSRHETFTPVCSCFRERQQSIQCSRSVPQLLADLKRGSCWLCGVDQGVWRSNRCWAYGWTATEGLLERRAFGR